MLWLGWSGFNGGDPFSANIDASLAVINTHICAATSILVWLTLDVQRFGKPSVIGAVQGMITGLVCITPAAGIYKYMSYIIDPIPVRHLVLCDRQARPQSSISSYSDRLLLNITNYLSKNLALPAELHI